MGRRRYLMCKALAPHSDHPPTPGDGDIMDRHTDPTARQAIEPVEAEPLDALVDDLMPRIRLLSPQLTTDEVRAAARRMALYRLDDEGGTWIPR